MKWTSETSNFPFGHWEKKGYQHQNEPGAKIVHLYLVFVFSIVKTESRVCYKKKNCLSSFNFPGNRTKEIQFHRICHPSNEISPLWIRSNAIDLAKLKILNSEILLRSSKCKAFRSLHIPIIVIRWWRRWIAALNPRLWISIPLHFQHFSLYQIIST